MPTNYPDFVTDYDFLDDDYIQEEKVARERAEERQQEWKREWRDEDER